MTYHPEGLEGPEWTVDFTPPFRRLKMFPDLEKALGAKLPAPDQLHTEEARAALNVEEQGDADPTLDAEGTEFIVHGVSPARVLRGH